MAFLGRLGFRLFRNKLSTTPSYRGCSSRSFLNHYMKWNGHCNTKPIPFQQIDPAATASTLHDEELESAITDLSTEEKKNGLTSCDSWCMEYEEPNVTIWSRPIKGKNYLEYKVHGQYDDIPAIAFYYIQMNLSHRKQWDSSTDAIELIGNKEVGDDKTELVYWRVNFPCMMAKRDYVFARRSMVDIQRNLMVQISKAVVHPDKPEDKKFVRVREYTSKMIIQPHKSFTQNGFDFVLTYVDNTRISLPSHGCKKIIRSAVPQFLETVHKESRTLIDSYHKYKLSGADMACCKVSHVRGLDKIIKDAKISPDQDTGQPTSSTTEYPPPERPSSNGILPCRVLIKKICPPEYLPDWKKYAEMIFKEKKFSPVPMRRVHGSQRRSDSSKHP